MPEGFDWSTPPFVKKVYDWPFAKTFWSIVPFYFIVAVATISLAHRANQPGWRLSDWTFIVVVVIAASLLVMIPICFLGKVVLTPETVCTMNDFGVRQTIRLDRIERAFKPWYGLHLFVIVKDRNVVARLWIPVFLNDMGDFKASLARVAPPENPLRAFLERGSGGSR